MILHKPAAPARADAIPRWRCGLVRKVRYNPGFLINRHSGERMAFPSRSSAQLADLISLRLSFISHIAAPTLEWEHRYTLRTGGHNCRQVLDNRPAREVRWKFTAPTADPAGPTAA